MAIPQTLHTFCQDLCEIIPLRVGTVLLEGLKRSQQVQHWGARHSGCKTAASPPLACACFYKLLDVVDVLSGKGNNAVSRLDVQVAPCKAA